MEAKLSRSSTITFKPVSVTLTFHTFEELDSFVKKCKNECIDPEDPLAETDYIARVAAFILGALQKC